MPITHLMNRRQIGGTSEPVSEVVAIMDLRRLGLVLPGEDTRYGI